MTTLKEFNQIVGDFFEEVVTWKIEPIQLVKSLERDKIKDRNRYRRQDELL